MAEEEEEEGLKEEVLFTELCRFTANDSNLFVGFPKTLTESAGKFFDALMTYIKDLKEPSGVVSVITLNSLALRASFVSRFSTLDSDTLSDSAKFTMFVGIMESFITSVFPLIAYQYVTTADESLNLDDVRSTGMNGGSGTECMMRFAADFHRYVTHVKSKEVENPENTYYWK